jgi:hypothetical protein
MQTQKEVVDPTTGKPFVVPAGVFDDAIRQQIESLLRTNVDSGRRGAVLAVLDERGLGAGVVAAVDKKGDWKLAADAHVRWDGEVSGRLMLVGQF